MTSKIAILFHLFLQEIFKLRAIKEILESCCRMKFFAHKLYCRRLFEGTLLLNIHSMQWSKNAFLSNPTWTITSTLSVDIYCPFTSMVYRLLNLYLFDIFRQCEYYQDNGSTQKVVRCNSPELSAEINGNCYSLPVFYNFLFTNP